MGIDAIKPCGLTTCKDNRKWGDIKKKTHFYFGFLKTELIICLFHNKSVILHAELKRTLLYYRRYEFSVESFNHTYGSLFGAVFLCKVASRCDFCEPITQEDRLGPAYAIRHNGHGGCGGGEDIARLHFPAFSFCWRLDGGASGLPLV